jgi:hypothetical protein
MKHQSRLIRQEQQQAENQHAQSTRSGAVEFATAEEALRQDREAIPVPPNVAERLEAAIGSEPPPRVSWWRRLLRR